MRILKFIPMFILLMIIPLFAQDVNSDGIVNGVDKSLVIANLGTTNSTYDIDGDGRVGSSDLYLVIKHIGLSLTLTSDAAEELTVDISKYSNRIKGIQIERSVSAYADKDAGTLIMSKSNIRSLNATYDLGTSGTQYISVFLEDKRAGWIVALRNTVLVEAAASGDSDPFPPSVDPPTVADFLPSPNNTYYCATDGNNSTGDGSIGEPWYDLEGARGTAGAGDLIYFRGGSYSINGWSWSDGSENSLRTNGSSGSPIVITNYPNETASWTSQVTAMTLAGEYQKLIGTKNGSGTCGFQFDGGISIDNAANYCQISGIRVVRGAEYGTNPALITYPHNTYNLNGLVISHNYLENSEHNTGGGHGDRMVCIRFFTTQNAIIEYNYFLNNTELYQGGAIYFKDATADAIVRYNKFINCEGGIAYSVQGNSFEGLELYSNLSYGCTYFLSFIADLGNSDEINIFDNVVLGLTSACMYYLNADNQDWLVHGDIYNNVIDGPVAAQGWIGTSSDLKNLPDLWDYNLWYYSTDRDLPSAWTYPSAYFDHAITDLNEITYDSGTQTATAPEGYSGLTAGRSGDCIGGFIWD